MNTSLIAPCGINCALCLGYQRKKNHCDGCLIEGDKPKHCAQCAIRNCPQKSGDPTVLCGTCEKFPCRRIKDLDKRYRTRYGVNLIENLRDLSVNGSADFVSREDKKWKCPQCGELLCMHRELCLSCGARNQLLPERE